ncbi:hypothetical protein SAMN05192552_104219 [Natrinema hispanicum]|uniref:Uncharacterized protein n=2 Tax=Natrinema hispanicum TaxID=392421 RepID=A0A1G6X2Y9_9EURY|nr:hypothetical protein SAMN05192552_104219 [Natrinema hispanicum]SEU07301.1 hypothetical protein SAMN04488694_13711 [Natrinema hispanicum]
MGLSRQLIVSATVSILSGILFVYALYMGIETSGMVMIGGVCLVFLGHLFATISGMSDNFLQVGIIGLGGVALFLALSGSQNELIFGAIILGGISAIESVYEQV